MCWGFLMQYWRYVMSGVEVGIKANTGSSRQELMKLNEQVRILISNSKITNKTLARMKIGNSSKLNNSLKDTTKTTKTLTKSFVDMGKKSSRSIKSKYEYC